MMIAQLLALSLASAAPPEVNVRVVDGQSVSGVVETLDGEGLALRRGSETVRIALERLLTLAPAAAESPAATAANVSVELSDGSSVAAADVTVAPGQATIALADGARVTLPVAAIRSVRFAPLSDDLAAQWREIAAESAADDRLIVEKDGSLDFLPAVVRAIGADSLAVELDGEQREVKRTKLAGVIMHHRASDAAGEGRCVVIDRSGSRWQAASLAAAGDKVRIDLPTGQQVELPWSSVARIDFSRGNVQYLSDLDPESSRFTPYVRDEATAAVMAEFYRPRRDESLTGQPLRLDGVDYAKGLALHARTELTFRLPAGFKRFQAIAGIDEALRGAGNVQLLIYADDRLVADAAIVGSEPPRTLDLDVAGAARLRIVADYGADLDVGDHLNLCDARIVK